jgi:hypothetical protein
MRIRAGKLIALVAAELPTRWLPSNRADVARKPSERLSVRWRLPGRKVL